MHIHIIGVCGTFMGGIAAMARSLGHEVTGSDANVYPPMSEQLQQLKIGLYQGYTAENLRTAPDLVLIGNALSRGNDEVEAVLNQGIPYQSGPQWLAENVLAGQHVLAVAGTHGKTTTTSMLAWILEFAGLEPGFLIGGIPENFGVSARLGGGQYFVIEADEYDTAFFDKRPKFLHYRPKTTVLNNLEFDHADIYPDLDAIILQFQYFLRTVPGMGHVIFNNEDPNLHSVMSSCWAQSVPIGADGLHQVVAKLEDCSHFDVVDSNGAIKTTIKWDLIGEYNMMNGLAAIVAAGYAGVEDEVASHALAQFNNVKRRLELRGEVAGISVYDDFAHHPTAIKKVIAALKSRIGNKRLIAVLEPRSNTMRMGVHTKNLAPALQQADVVMLFKPNDLGWNPQAVTQELSAEATVYDRVDDLIKALSATLQADDHVLIMSNGGFENIHNRLLMELNGRKARQGCR